MKRHPLERTFLLLKAFTLTAMIGGSIPTLVFAQSSQITNYSGSASAASQYARLNGSVSQSSSNGTGSSMRMVRSQAVSTSQSAPPSAPPIAPPSAPPPARVGSLFSSGSASMFGATPQSSSVRAAQSSAPARTAPPPQAQAGYSGTAGGASFAPQQAQADNQSQGSRDDFDFGKAIKMGASALHTMNSLVAATRPPVNPLYGSSQMTNSLFNRNTLMGGAQSAVSFGAPPMLPGGVSGSGMSGGLSGGLSGGSTLLNGAANQIFHMGRPLTRNEVSLLGNYDVAVVIDRSGSMQTRDCPGGMSRWDFCREQLLSLTSQAGSAFRNGITVALFSSDYQIFNNVNVAAVPQIFAENVPDGGTYLSRPLEEIFGRYFSQRDMGAPTKPLLIEIITDGEPSDKGALIRVICEATQKMRNPREVNVQFLQIGSGNEGARVLNELETRLVPEDGAQYGIVNVEPFQEVLSEGLAHSLVAVATGH